MAGDPGSDGGGPPLFVGLCGPFLNYYGGLSAQKKNPCKNKVIRM